MKTYSIVAMEHCKSNAFVAELKPGVDAVLVREPTNPYDANAVAVHIDGTRVGYIQKKHNVALAQFIDQIGQLWVSPSSMAQDSVLPAQKAITAKFIRSPNSGYPQVVVDA